MTDEAPQPDRGPIGEWHQGCFRFLFKVWWVMSIIVGFAGTLAGIIALMIPGRVKFLQLQGKPVETIGEKLTALGFGILFLVVGCFFWRRSINRQQL